MEVRLVYFYPHLMNLYGSYANLTVLKRRLERMGCAVAVEAVGLEKDPDLQNADFLFMGAGTERRQKMALKDFLRFEKEVRSLAEDSVAMLFAGTAMELLGKTITDAGGETYAGIGLGGFSSLQGKTRIVEDVYALTDLYPDPVVGFINKCSTITGVETPLLGNVLLGYGNEGKKTPEGFRYKNVLGSHLTGPLLVKNPRMLDEVVRAIYRRRGEPPPSKPPQDPWAEEAYAVTAEQLKLRCET